MKNSRLIFACAILLLLGQGSAATDENGPVLRIAPGFGAAPLAFIANRGQAAPEALFYAKTNDYTLWLTRDGLVFDRGDSPIDRASARLRFQNASPDVRISAADPTDYRVSYFYGRDESDWITDVPTSRAVLYKNLYDGIDLKVYGTDKQIEYDWIVRPGAEPGAVRFGFQGVSAARLDPSGDLIVTTARGELRHRRPTAYQVVDGRKIGVSASYLDLGQNDYGFAAGPYDPGRDLVIDPLVIVSSTYLGGSAPDYCQRLAVDAAGAVYVAGYTQSADFPPYEVSRPRVDAFVSKLSADGSSLIYSAFFPMLPIGSGDLIGLAVDAKGSAYLTGTTNSRKFPVKNAFQDTIGGIFDGFFLKLTPSGRGLVFSSYLGGSGQEFTSQIALGADGSLYVGGTTTSRDFPLRRPYQKTLKGYADVFIAKFDPDGRSLSYSTLLGGNGSENVWGLAVDESGAAYVTGETSSTSFPVKNAFQKKLAGGLDAYIAKLAPKGDTLVYSSFLGGGSTDAGQSVAVDGSGAAWVTGNTNGAFPVKNAFQKTRRGGSDAFVTKVAPDGRTLAYSTFLGGAGTDTGNAIALDGNGNVYVIGTTTSWNFPCKNAGQASLKGPYDAFLSILAPDGRSLVASTYLGGSYWDFGTGLVLAADGTILVSGSTNSLDFPTLKPYQKALKGSYDAFILKYKLKSD
jgi:hypothetical protein